MLGDKLKIGITAAPERRRRALETGTGEKVGRWAQYWVYAPGACERQLHGMCGVFRLEGEYFCHGPRLFEELSSYLLPKQAKVDIVLGES